MLSNKKRLLPSGFVDEQKTEKKIKKNSSENDSGSASQDSDEDLFANTVAMDLNESGDEIDDDMELLDKDAKKSAAQKNEVSDSEDNEDSEDSEDSENSENSENSEEQDEYDSGTEEDDAEAEACRKAIENSLYLHELNPLQIPDSFLNTDMEVAIKLLHPALSKLIRAIKIIDGDEEADDDEIIETPFLRRYQISIIIDLVNGWMQGKRNAVIPLATGGGKTAIFLWILQNILELQIENTLNLIIENNSRNTKSVKGRILIITPYTYLIN